MTRPNRLLQVFLAVVIRKRPCNSCSNAGFEQLGNKLLDCFTVNFYKRFGQERLTSSIVTMVESTKEIVTKVDVVELRPFKGSAIAASCLRRQLHGQPRRNLLRTNK